MDRSALSVSDLKAELRLVGLPCSGNKSVLVARLEAFHNETGDSSGRVEPNGDEQVHTSEDSGVQHAQGSAAGNPSGEEDVAEEDRQQGQRTEPPATSVEAPGSTDSGLGGEKDLADEHRQQGATGIASEPTATSDEAAGSAGRNAGGGRDLADEYRQQGQTGSRPEPPATSAEAPGSADSKLGGEEALPDEHRQQGEMVVSAPDGGFSATTDGPEGVSNITEDLLAFFDRSTPEAPAGSAATEAASVAVPVEAEANEHGQPLIELESVDAQASPSTVAVEVPTGHQSGDDVTGASDESTRLLPAVTDAQPGPPIAAADAEAVTLGDSVELSSVPGDATVLQPLSQTVGMSVPVAEPGGMQLDVADSEVEECFGLDEAFKEDKKLDLVIGEAFV